MKDILISGRRGTGKTYKATEKFVESIIKNNFDEHYIIAGCFYYQIKKRIISLFENEGFECDLNKSENMIYLRSEKRNIKIKLYEGEDLRYTNIFLNRENKKLLWIDNDLSFRELNDFLESRNIETKFILSTEFKSCDFSLKNKIKKMIEKETIECINLSIVNHLI